MTLWHRHRFGLLGAGCLSLGVLLLSQIVRCQDLGTPATVAILTSNAADLGSTIYALQQPGTREGNPILGSSLASIVPLKVAGTVLQVLGARAMAHAGHPRLAKVFAWVTSTALVGIAAHNVQQGRR